MMNKPLEIQGSLLARNTLLNLIGQGLPLVVAVVTIPFIIQGLGIDRFGLLSLAWVVLGYFAIFDLGLGRATTKFVAEALGKGEEDQVPRLVWTAVTVQAFFGLLGAIVLASITPFLVERILNIPQELIKEAKDTFYLLSLSIPVVLVSSSFRGVLEAAQRFDLVNIVRVPSSTLTFLLPLVGLFLGFNLPGIVSLILVVRLAELAVFVVMSIQIAPRIKRYSGTFALFPRLFSFGGWVTVSSIVGPLLLYMDRFLIGSLLTMAAVAYYAAPLEVTMRLWIIPASLAMTLFPAFSAIGTTHKEDLQRLYMRSIKYLLLVTGPIVLVFIAFANNILQFWLGPDFAQQSTLVFQILLLGALIGLLAPVSGTLLQGLGRPDIISKLYLLYLPLNIGMVWFLVQNMGIVGAALSFALRALIETVLLFIISSKFIRLPFSSLIKNGLWRSVSILVVIGVLLWGISYINIFAMQIGFVIIVVLLFVIIVWRYALDETDKRIVVLAIDRIAWFKKVQHKLIRGD
jgi:O-antigen/teichoic acid export membrane protein